MWIVDPKNWKCKKKIQKNWNIKDFFRCFSSKSCKYNRIKWQYVKITDNSEKFVKKIYFYSKIYEILDKVFCIFIITPNNDLTIKTSQIEACRITNCFSNNFTRFQRKLEKTRGSNWPLGVSRVNQGREFLFTWLCISKRANKHCRNRQFYTGWFNFLGGE